MKSRDQSSTTSNGTPICVFFPGALGDFICFLPALRWLSRLKPVILYAHSEFADLVPATVTVRSLESREINRLFIARTPDQSPLLESFDVFAWIYSWMGSQQPVFVERLQEAALGRATLFPFRSSAPAEHQMDYYLRCLGVSNALLRQPTLEIDDTARRWGDDFWSDNSLQRRPVLSIAAGSGAREKNWPEEFFIALADWWRERIGGVAMLLIGPVELARGGIDRLREHCLVASNLKLAQVTALLSRSTVYLGNDSGMSHLAAALGVPTVALFGPSDPLQWAPRGRRVTVISRRVHCSPCAPSVMKICPQRVCLSEISPAQVIDAMLEQPEVATLTRGGVGITV
jgi:ADP-heptose:LPS heptosyltransferase